MNWLLKIVAILIILDGIVLLFRPDFLKKYIEIFTKGKGIYIAAIIKAALGAIFLFGASDKCSHQWVIIAFGILALAGTVFIIIIPQKARAMAEWFAARNNTTLRLFSIIYILVGALLVYSA
ncbi:MAG: hypothetical protein NTW93_07865 [Phycisphaerae bacterium]|nr:hypothetical protein [Phycisphaerae bacterium]